MTKTIVADGLLAASAVELAAQIRRGELSSVELVTACLARIEAVNPRLSAVVQIDSGALERARGADAALAAGEATGPLHGVPFTVKDWIETEGLVCAAGFAERHDHRPTRDATVVARMRAAGAVLVGKTNVGRGAPVYPRPGHPADPELTPGHSSGGEAAIIAAGGSPLGLASDSGGSIRWPAHCCGVAGLRPSVGRVPNTGHFPRIGHLSDPRTVIGPMARRVADLEAALGVIAGEDGIDPGVAPAPLGAAADVDLAALRVAWFVDDPDEEVTPETAAAVRAAADALKDRGCAVQQIDAPWLKDALTITRAYWARRASISHSSWSPVGMTRLNEAEIERSIFEWERFSRRILALMGGCEIILSPVAARPAPRHDAWGDAEYRFTVPWSLTGQPAVSVPFACSPEGLPIGVQVIARRWRDDQALAAALALEAVRA
jgi:amidase